MISTVRVESFSAESLGKPSPLMITSPYRIPLARVRRA